ncbi:hypothetical protein D029_2796B, partial [Vibrio parahaemolyticus 970107]
EP